jgi:two-component system chemotaxis response regulator CheY
MSKKILFVDDSPTMRRIIRNTLNRIGYEDLIEAEHGMDALEKLNGQSVDLIITDWNMPEMSGEELIKVLRGDANYKDIPVLMITTRGMKDDVMTALALGVNGYVVKPFTPEVIKKKITELIG